PLYRGTRICKRHLAQLFLVVPPTPCPHPPRSLDHVLLLPALPAHRATRPLDPHRPLRRPPPRNCPQDSLLSRRYLPMSCSPSQHPMACPGRRQCPVEGDLRTTHRSKVSQ